MRGYWKELYHARWVILGISAATFVLSWIGMLGRFETAGLDTFNILQAPKDPSHVVIVGITEEDYASKLFNATSPLSVSSVQRILTAIADAHPSVIGIDLDTSGDAFQNLKTQPDWPPVVWAHEGIWSEKTRTFHKERVLGGLDPEHVRDDTGLSAFPVDSDGIVRRFARYFPLDGGGVEPSFAWALVTVACQKDNPRRVPGCDALPIEKISEEESKETLRLNFAGQRFNFDPLSVQPILKTAEDPQSQWSKSSPFRNQIVLLGGFYHAARDFYVTPVGGMEGVQLMGQTIETEFSGLRSLNEFVMVVLDLATGALLVFISYRYPLQLGKALMLSLLSLVVVPPLCSLIAFSTLSLWFNFVPMIVGVLIHELYEHGREYSHLREKFLAEERARMQHDG